MRTMARFFLIPYTSVDFDLAERSLSGDSFEHIAIDRDDGGIGTVSSKIGNVHGLRGDSPRSFKSDTAKNLVSPSVAKVQANERILENVSELCRDDTAGT